MPEKIPVSILSEGIKDLKLIKEWGEYLAKEEGFAKDKVGKLSTSQIRKFFGSIKRIQASFEKAKGEILLLEPKLAYAMGRDKGKSKIKDLFSLLSPMIQEIKEDKAKFQNFVNVLEAIVAYHKAAGGE
ncbi:type III-A CRISPR-associated protein Csm2 [Arcicella sp. LKC2W]|uniref:type III-A CRISPR-associated protein Csm2 n=1 Tax=Arcicella sp. LKC2W TaxID=2984198 RepID=UPI002B1F530F|nr:type III-A CRISPR-associated protein Csm2 [Arcicella sp. LKC2W]MEA5461604.1 type III-A CRISPR-associated protein Csm2 [Arcicella sp. LKC2W]